MSANTANTDRLTEPAHLSYDSILPSGAVAQLAERLARIQEATGSSPVSSTNRSKNLQGFQPAFLCSLVAILWQTFFASASDSTARRKFRSVA